MIRAELGGWTRDGHVRQTSFKGIEIGKDPRSVVREIPIPSKTAIAAAESEEPAVAKKPAKSNKPTKKAAEPPGLAKPGEKR